MLLRPDHFCDGWRDMSTYHPLVGPEPDPDRQHIERAIMLSVEETMAQILAVSYTHLTLPTTPYV